MDCRTKAGAPVSATVAGVAPGTLPARLAWAPYLGALLGRIAFLPSGVLRPDRTEWSVHVLLPVESVGIGAVGRRPPPRAPSGSRGVQKDWSEPSVSTPKLNSGHTPDRPRYPLSEVNVGFHERRSAPTAGFADPTIWTSVRGSLAEVSVLPINVCFIRKPSQKRTPSNQSEGDLA
jgi:hypothetical protein